MSIPGPRSRCGILGSALISMFAIGLGSSPVGSPGSPQAPDAPPTLDAATHLAGADEGWWRTVSNGLQQQEYEATVGERGLQAPNRAQNLRTHFGPRGIEVGPRLGDATSGWRFGWETASLGRPGQMVDAEPAVLECNASRINYTRPGWTEWYENTPAGLEQGFTLDQRPVGEGPLRIAGTFAAGLLAEFNNGEVDFFDAQGARVLHYGKLAAYDVDGEGLPCKLVIEGQTLAIEVDDRGAAYPITVDPLMTSPAWTTESNQAFAIFGSSVATAGDVNGDGFSDVIIGAWLYDNGESGEGRAFAYHGSSAGLATTPAWTAESNQADAQFGYSVATAGDVNGDGFSDVIVGADLYANGESREGGAFVYHGSASGLAPTPAWTAESNQVFAIFGISAATAGDVNGDGFSDVIVGAYGYTNGESFEGRAFAYHGSAAGLATTPAWTAESNQAFAEFGISVATAGDVNGDGFSDVIVGADLYANGEGNEGRAFVYHGSAAGLAPTPAWTAEPNQTSAQFGRSVWTAGDVNGDGFSDVIVGAWLYDNGEIDEGRAFAYQGSAGGLATTPAWTAESNQAGANFGGSVATAGDVNGDGFSDVIVGAWFYDNGETDEGRAFAYQGSAGGLATTPAWTAESNQAGAQFGVSVATAGDVNGDGFSDVIVGANAYDNGENNEGRAFLYHGGSDGLALNPAWFTNGGQTNGGWGWSVGTAGDVNGDGYSDVIVVADRYDSGQADEGKTWVYHGSRTGVPIFSGWSAETNQVGAQLSSAASAGDVNGDGYSDVIIGAYRYDGGQSDEGRTYLYLGSPAGLSGTAAWTSEPDQASAWFGWSVGSAGDVNGDGYADVLVGADGWDNGQSSEGRAWLYLGSAGGLGGPTWSVEGDQEGASLGYSVETGGDVNGDGFSDVLIALPTYDNGQLNEGVVWVFHGSEDGLGATPSLVLEANQANALFGFDVATAGDVNGDGYSDVIIGAQSYDGLQTDAGRALVYHGGAGGLVAVPAWMDEPNQASAQYGRSVATAGDVNGDGYSDVIVGASHMDVGAFNDGAVWVYHGSPAGLGAPAWFNYGGQTDAFFGIAVGTAGDVNADGFSDVIIGALGYDYGFTDEGATWVFLGNRGAGLDRVRQQMQTDATAPIDLLGRSDSETAVLLHAVGRTPAGRGRVRLEVEMKPAGTPFDGTGLETSVFANTGVPGVDGSAISFLQSVSGLAPGTLYHWRLRTVSDSPFFPRSPWLWLPYNGVTEGDVRTGGTAAGMADDSAPPATGQWLERAIPNPFTTATEFTFTLPHQATVQLGVFDVQGRIVAKLAEGAQHTGRHVVRWDGCDPGGDQLPAGVYFVRLESAGHVEAQKIVRSR